METKKVIETVILPEVGVDGLVGYICEDGTTYMTTPDGKLFSKDEYMKLSRLPEKAIGAGLDVFGALDRRYREIRNKNN